MSSAVSVIADRAGTKRWSRSASAFLVMSLPLASLVSAGATPSQAASVNPLPAVASALARITSYQVVVTSSTSGTFPRPKATPQPGVRRGPRGGAGLGFGFGRGTRTIVAVRKGSYFEDYVVINGTDRAGKATTTSAIIYGTKFCSEAAGAHSYTCRTGQNEYFIDPTAAFAAGAGSTTFTRTSSKTIAGLACDGYAYKNVSQSLTATGAVYIDPKTNLPCEQDSSQTRHTTNGNGTFTQTSTAIWSRFNDKRLTVPSVPS